jgi:hypothetical protein
MEKGGGGSEKVWQTQFPLEEWRTGRDFLAKITQKHGKKIIIYYKITPKT